MLELSYSTRYKNRTKCVTSGVCVFIQSLCQVLPAWHFVTCPWPSIFKLLLTTTFPEKEKCQPVWADTYTHNYNTDRPEEKRALGGFDLGFLQVNSQNWNIWHCIVISEKLLHMFSNCHYFTFKTVSGKHTFSLHNLHILQRRLILQTSQSGTESLKPLQTHLCFAVDAVQLQIRNSLNMFASFIQFANANWLGLLLPTQSILFVTEKVCGA